MLGFSTSTLHVTRLLIIRHGQGLWNQAGRVQGQQDIALSPVGLRQAEALGNRLRSTRLDAVYASPLLRARQTAAAVAGPHRLEVRLDPDLAEIHHGRWEGMTEADVALHYAELLDLWRTQPSQVQMPEGEHFADCQQRGLAAVERIAAAHPAQAVAVVTHDVVVKAVIAHVLGLAADHITRFHVDNTGICVVAYGSDGAVVQCVNDVAHLATL